MADPKDRPSILISLERGVSEDAWEWVSYGAEEEGVPCRLEEDATGSDTVEQAYNASTLSRFGIGIGIGSSEIVLHEAHMPKGTPVLRRSLRDGNALEVCRMFGHNAARMVTQRPLLLQPVGSNDVAVGDGGNKNTRAQQKKHEPETQVPEIPEIKKEVTTVTQETVKEGDRFDTEDVAPDEIKRAVSAVIRNLRERGVL
jgi:hypothetical protein